MKTAAGHALEAVVVASAVLDTTDGLFEALKGMTGDTAVQEVSEHADRDTFELYLVSVEATLALVQKRLGTCGKLLGVLKTVARPQAAEPEPALPALPRVVQGPSAHPARITQLAPRARKVVAAARAAGLQVPASVAMPEPEDEAVFPEEDIDERIAREASQE